MQDAARAFRGRPDAFGLRRRDGAGYLSLTDGVIRRYDGKEPDAEECRFVKPE